jgi:ribonucleoside-triphosphate reductase
MKASSEKLEIYSKRVAKAHFSGDIHIHNLNHPKKAESIGWSIDADSCEPTLKDRFKTCSYKIKKNQTNYLKQTITDFDLGFSQIKKKYTRDEVRNNLIWFLKSIKTPNKDFHLSFNLNIEKETHIFNEALCDSLLCLNNKGDFNQTPIIVITNEFNWNNKLLNNVIEWAFKYGTPVFIKSRYDSHEFMDLPLRQGGYLGDKTGNGRIGSVTINLPRLGFKAKDEDDFFELLNELAWLASRSLEEKRRYLENSGLTSNKNFFSVISLIGMHETLINLINCGIADSPGKAVTYKILESLRRTLQDINNCTGNPYSLETTPSMLCSYRLAQIDKKKYPKIITSGKDISYYTHTTELPANHGNDLWYALEHQKKIQALYSGGASFQLYLEKELKFREECKLLLKRIFNVFDFSGVIINPAFYICTEHGYMNFNRCIKCGKKTILHRRTGGTIQSIDQWDKGQKEEYKLRENFDVKNR